VKSIAGADIARFDPSVWRRLARWFLRQTSRAWYITSDCDRWHFHLNWPGDVVTSRFLLGGREEPQQLLLLHVIDW
jgi:hypothetical protein